MAEEKQEVAKEAAVAVVGVRDDLLTHTVSLAALERLTVHLLALHLAGAEDPKRAAVLLKKSFGGEAPDAADAKAQELVEAACRAAGL
jgi:hypothetical protein